MQGTGTSTSADRSTLNELIAPVLAAASRGTVPASGSGGGGPGLAASAVASARAHRKYLINLYVKEYWWSIAGFIGILAVLHLAGLASSWIILRSARVHSSSTPDEEKGSVAVSSAPPPSSFLVRAWRSARAFVNIALFRTALPLRWLHNLSNVSEALVIGAYFGATIAWALMNAVDVHKPTNWYARSGMIAANQIPFIVALAGKNNVITWLTGLSHEKLNVVHRAAGRAVLVIGWIHMCGVLWMWILSHAVNPFHDHDMRWGLTAAVSLSLTFVFSLRPIRKLAYEIFLTGHIIFVCIFMLGVIMHQPSVKARVWPGFVFWAFDRCLRFSRFIWINFVSHPSPSSSSEAGTEKGVSSIERLSSDTVKLSIRRSKNLLSSWRAGQHFFITAPGMAAIPWEAHPFTPASIPHSLHEGTEKEREVELNFIIRGRHGFTKNLLQHAIAHESKTDKMTLTPILVDGPYGQPPNLGTYDTSILIAGGSGVSYTLSMLLDRIHRSRQGRDRTSRVLFVWVIRDAAHVSWIIPALREALDAPSSTSYPLDIDIRVFITRSGAEGVPISLEGKSEKETKAPQYQYSGPAMEATETLVDVIEREGGCVYFKSGRPDFRKVIDEELAESDGLNVSVDVSGPARLADSVRHVLATSPFATPAAAFRGGPSVTLHTETFGW